MGQEIEWVLISGMMIEEHMKTAKESPTENETCEKALERTLERNGKCNTPEGCQNMENRRKQKDTKKRHQEHENDGRIMKGAQKETERTQKEREENNMRAVIAVQIHSRSEKIMTMRGSGLGTLKKTKRSRRNF